MATLIWKSKSSSDKLIINYRTMGWQVGMRSYAWSPPTDVYQTETNFVVRVEIAGMREADLSITIHQDCLVISGRRTEAVERRAYQQMEIRFGDFNTAVELPSGVNIDQAEAEYEDGFLTIVLPKIKHDKK